jgi:hypothetical protein
MARSTRRVIRQPAQLKDSETDMTTFVLEMRSTANWNDVRYREYTTSEKKAELFKKVPKIQFTDSGHGIVPAVREHSKGRPREPRNMVLQDHVVDALKAMSPVAGCHCGKDGHALNSTNCPVHGKSSREAKMKAALESIAGWDKINIQAEYESGLRGIIRSMADCARTALEATS